jgi:hypothetical protein
VNTALATHTSNTANPHSVTAVQVGADPAGSAAGVQMNLNTLVNSLGTAALADAVDFDFAGSAAAVNTALATHVGNTANPHGVTAAQVGADPAGSASAVNTALTTHTSNTANPHGVTAVQVGADPAGSAAARVAKAGDTMTGVLTISVANTSPIVVENPGTAGTRFVVRGGTNTANVGLLLQELTNTRGIVGWQRAESVISVSRGFGSNAGIHLLTTNDAMGVGTRTPAARIHAMTTSALVGHIVQLAVSQTADALQVQSSTSTVLAKIEANGTVQAAGYKSADGSTGWTGTFTSGGGATVTVKNGIITNVA